MNATNKNNPLTHPVLAAQLTDKRWLALHVLRFKKIRPGAFDIDWANSEDASRRLKPTEFGYRSVHDIVSVNPQESCNPHSHA